MKCGPHSRTISSSYEEGTVCCARGRQPVLSGGENGMLSRKASSRRVYFSERSRKKVRKAEGRFSPQVILGGGDRSFVRNPGGRKWREFRRRGIAEYVFTKEKALSGGAPEDKKCHFGGRGSESHEVSFSGRPRGKNYVGEEAAVVRGKRRFPSKKRGRKLLSCLPATWRKKGSQRCTRKELWLSGGRIRHSLGSGSPYERDFP